MAASKLIFLIIGVVACLTTPTTANLSESQKNELIEAHNFYRAKPRSSNMVALVSHTIIFHAMFDSSALHCSIISRDIYCYYY